MEPAGRAYSQRWITAEPSAAGVLKWHMYGTLGLQQHCLPICSNGKQGKKMEFLFFLIAFLLQ